MGYGPISNGRHTPITPWEGSWAQEMEANAPIPDHVKTFFNDQHAATHTQRLTLPGRFDVHGRPLE